MQKSLKIYIIYSFLFVIIFYNYDFSNSVPPSFNHHNYIIESLESFNNQTNEDAQQHKLNTYDKLQNLNGVEDFKIGLTTEALNCIHTSKIYYYSYPKSDYIFIKGLLLINKGPPDISYLVF